jgi:acetyl esterase/lipase
MKLSTLCWVLVAVLLAANIRAAEPKDAKAPPSQQSARASHAARPALTDEAVRAEDRLYSKTPQGDLYLHFFFPSDWKADDNRPAIVFFFGGAWRTGSYLAFVPQAQYFATRGLVTASADYRIRTKHHTAPDKAVEDAVSAVRWIRSHAGELGIDPNKIIAAGGSAGAHLAASTALLEDFGATRDDADVSCRPNALVLFNPVLDLMQLPRRAPDAGMDDRLRKQLSPTLYLKKSAPPAILFYGSADKFFAQGEAYVAKAKELNVRADLYVAPNMPHGFFNRSPWTEVTTQKADEFLASLGYLKGPPTIKLPPDAPKLEERGTRSKERVGK